MKPTKLLVAALILACAVLATRDWQLRGKIADLERQNTSPRRESAITPQRDRDVGSDMGTQAQDVAAAGTDSPLTEQPPSAARNFSREELASLTRNPAFQGIMATQQAAVQDMTYGVLFERFELSPEEREYFGKLLLERQMMLANLGMQLVNISLGEDERNAIGRQIQEGIDASDAKIRIFLNDDRDFADYKTYARQEPERFEVGMFMKSADGIDTATAEALADLLGDTRKQHPFTVDFYDNSNLANVGMVNAATIDKFLDEQARFQAEVAEQAARLLTPAQREAFAQNQAAVRQMMKMQLHGILQLAGNAP